MSRSLGFPTPAIKLLRSLLGALLTLVIFCAGLAAWFHWSLTPLQSYYFNVYTASSATESQPHSMIQVRWVMKTAPGRAPVLMLPSDDVRGGTPKLPIALSEKALGAGWRGVTLSPPERGPAARLAPLLQHGFYEDESLGTLFLLPLVFGIGGLIFLALAFRKAKESWGYQVSSWQQTWAEERHVRRTKGPQQTTVAEWNRTAKAGGIQLKLQWGSESLRVANLLPFGPTFRIPKRLESNHILLMGDTGSGKSSAIRQILRQVQQRGESAIVYDPAMDFVEEFYDPKRGDLILNPLDARCPYWNLGDEIDQSETAATIAAAFLPEKEYEKAFFTDSPRRILAHLLRRRPQTRDILARMSHPEQIEWAVKGTPLAALVDPAAPAQRAGVLSSLNLIADSLELLPEWEHKRTVFSTTEWGTQRKRWVFLTSAPAYRGKILPLHSVWLDLLILRMMGGCEDREAKPVWFVLDELASLNKLPQLHTAVTENRKYGNPVVLGFQGRSQMEKRYGQDAEAMLSQPATKVFFKTSEPRAAKWVSEAIGEIEVERLKESRTLGLLTSKRSYAMEIATKPLVMASEIAGLSPLQAFIKQENRVVPVRFRLAKKRGRQPAFIARKMPESQSRIELNLAEPPTPAIVSPPPQAVLTPAIAAALTPASAPPKKPVQSVPPLATAPSVQPKAVFVWDESKGID